MINANLKFEADTANGAKRTTLTKAGQSLGGPTRPFEAAAMTFRLRDPAPLRLGKNGNYQVVR